MRSNDLRQYIARNPSKAKKIVNKEMDKLLASMTAALQEEER